MHVTDRIGLLLEANYGITSHESVGMAHGTLSNVWKIRVRDAYLGLKRSHITDRARWGDITRILSVLRDHGLPVVTPVRAVDGSTVCFFDGGAHTLYHWIRGTDAHGVLLVSADAESLGATLGEVHSALRGIDKAHSLRRRLPEDVAGTIDRIRLLQKQLSQRQCRCDKDMSAMKVLGHKLRVLSQGYRISALATSMYDDSQLVHGDYQRHNIIYDPAARAVVGLVDLESFHYAPRIWDIGRACAYMFACDAEMMCHFMLGYHRVNPLTGVEVATITEVLVDYLITSLWTCEEYVLKGNNNVDIEGTLACFERLQRDREALQARLECMLA